MANALDLRPVTDTDEAGDNLLDLPAESDRPCFIVLDDERAVRGRDEPMRAGVWSCWMTRGTKSEPPEPRETWISGPIHAGAQTHDADGNDHGRLLRFQTSTGRWRPWAMPQALLGGQGDALLSELLGMGLLVSHPHRAKLVEYLARQTPRRIVRCTTSTGWADADAFVLPDTVIGPGAPAVVYQNGERAPEGYGAAGTLDDWRQRVAAPAEGNPWAVLAISTAFAGPLLARCHLEGGGVHFMGASSTGKTTLAEIAASAWGHPDKFKRSWRATANGVEGVAALHNDLLLPLDEISECDPREVGAVAYMVANGVGKARASRTGAARPPRRWRVFVVSTGERTIASTMMAAGRRQMAGQQVRLLDLPAERRHGVFDDLHGRDNGRALADELKTAAASYHGTSGRAFLERLTADDRDLGARYERARALSGFASDGGQEARAAARFALIGLAGELATEYGLTGWREGAALDAAVEGFRAWLDHRGHGQDEPTKIRQAVADFIDRHGHSRFEPLHADNHPVIRDRCGWRDGERYLFTRAGLTEAVGDFDPKAAVSVLIDCGALEPGTDRPTQSKWAGARKCRLYVINADRLEGAGDGT